MLQGPALSTTRPFRAASRLAISVLISAAPAGAALPEEAVEACNAIHTADAIFVGRPQPPIEVRVSFEDRIEPARQRWLKANEEASRSNDRELHIKAVRAHEEYEHLQSSYPSPHNMIVVPIEVETSFKDALPTTVFMQAPFEPLEPRREYLFFGQFVMPTLDRRIMLPVSIPRLADHSAYALPLIMAATSATHGGVVYGSLSYESPRDPDSAASPASGVSVRIASTGFLFDTVTDSDGTFIVTGVPPGEVTIAPALPVRTTILSAGSAKGTLHEGGCVPLNILVVLDGRIRGRITGADGRPRPDLTIQLLPAEWSNLGPPSDARYGVRTNERGEFEFLAIPPGSYFLGHQIHRSDAIPPGGYPPRTFYPGTPDRTAAIPIVVGDATQHDGLDFVVVW